MDTNAALTDSCPENLQGVSGYLFITLINSLFGSKCKLGANNQYNDDYAKNLKNGQEFDFIVIGAGSAGSVLANKLSETSQWSVLVLEAGGYPSSTSDVPALLYSIQGTEEDWQYKTEPSSKSCLGFKDEQCRWPRGKVLGGSSTLNAMLYIRGNKRDYDQWAELGNIGWDWKNIKEQFRQMENIKSWPNKYDSGFPLKYALQEAYKLKGYKNLQEDTPENPIGTLEANTCIENGIRHNAAKAFLGKYKDRKNLFTSLNTVVQKIIIDPETKKATGVKVKIGKTSLTLKSKKEIVLCGGSVNSPQLLMLSGVGPKKNLKEVGVNLIKDLPVGENLQDHIMHWGLDIAVNSDAILPEHKTENMPNILYDYYMHQKGLLGTVGLLNFWGFINTKNNSIYPNIQFHHTVFTQNNNFFWSEMAAKLGVKDEIFVTKMDYLKTTNTINIFSTLLNPKSTGTVLLKTNNPEDHPLIYSGYFSDDNEEDIKVMLEAIRFVENLIETPPLQKFNPQILKHNLPACDKYEFRSDEYWKCSLRHLSSTVYHPTSTCMMGPKDDGTSVVDPRLRVHGIKNLRVADASIMPKIVSVNTHAPVMMIGHKSGVMITEDWLQKHEEL